VYIRPGICWECSGGAGRTELPAPEQGWSKKVDKRKSAKRIILDDIKAWQRGWTFSSK